MSAVGKGGKETGWRASLFDSWPILFPVLVGIMVGFWPQEVLAGRFPRHAPPYPVAWFATFFWGTLVAGSLVTLFYFRRARQQAEDAAEKAEGAANDIRTLKGQAEDAAEKAKDAANDIRTLTGQVETLSKDLNTERSARKKSNLGAEAMRLAYQDYLELKNQPEAAVRRVLWWFAWLAWVIDGQPAGVRYASNAMWFKPWATASPTLRKLMILSDYEEDGEIDGLLVLEPRFSTTRIGRAKDGRLRTMALPVPKTTARTPDGRHRVLPGAPRAFVEKGSAAEFYGDAMSMVAHCAKDGLFKESVTLQLKTYLTSDDGRLVGSLVAAVLVPANADQPIGVLNIHRDSPGILDGSALAFVEATVSLRALLAHALAGAVKSG